MRSSSMWFLAVVQAAVWVFLAVVAGRALHWHASITALVGLVGAVLLALVLPRTLGRRRP